MLTIYDLLYDLLFYRLDPREPKHMELNLSPSFVPFSPEIKKTFHFWDSIWEDVPPRMHFKDVGTWKDEKKFRGFGEDETKTGTKSEL